MFVLKVEKHNIYQLFVTNTISKLYRQLKESSEQLEIGITPDEIGSHSKLRREVKRLDHKSVLEIEIKDILFTIVKAKEIPMLYNQMEKNLPKEKKSTSKVTRKSII